MHGRRLLAVPVVCIAGALTALTGTARADLANVTATATPTSVTVTGTEADPACLLPLGSVSVEVFDSATSGALFDEGATATVDGSGNFSVTFPNAGAVVITPGSILPSTQYGAFVDDNCPTFANLTVTTPAFGAAAPQPPGRGGYCSATGDTNPATGAAYGAGTYLDLMLGQPATDVHYKGAAPANYYQGIGLSCDPPPAGFEATGALVDETGAATQQHGSAVYPYYAKR